MRCNQISISNFTLNTSYSIFRPGSGYSSTPNTVSKYKGHNITEISQTRTLVDLKGVSYTHYWYSYVARLGDKKIETKTPDELYRIIDTL